MNFEAMRCLILILPFLFLAPQLRGQDSTCIQTFKTGTFTYKGKKEEVEVIRTKSTQIERYNGGNSELVLSIDWSSDSSYILTLQRAINAPGCLEKGDTIRTRISRCEKGRLVGRSETEDCGGQEFVMVEKE